MSPASVAGAVAPAAERDGERVGELCGVVGAELGESVGELGLDLAHRVRGAYSGRGAQDLAERPEGDPSPVGRVAAQEDPRPRLGL